MHSSHTTMFKTLMCFEKVNNARWIVSSLLPTYRKRVVVNHVRQKPVALSEQQILQLSAWSPALVWMHRRVICISKGIFALPQAAAEYSNGSEDWLMYFIQTHSDTAGMKWGTEKHAAHTAQKSYMCLGSRRKTASVYNTPSDRLSVWLLFACQFFSTSPFFSSLWRSENCQWMLVILMRKLIITISQPSWDFSFRKNKVVKIGNEHMQIFLFICTMLSISIFSLCIQILSLYNPCYVS